MKECFTASFLLIYFLRKYRHREQRYEAKIRGRRFPMYIVYERTQLAFTQMK